MNLAARGAIARMLAAVKRIRRPSARVRAVLLVVAGVGVVIGMWASARAIDLDPAQVNWWLLAVIGLVVTPLGVALNALELKVMATAVAPDTGGATIPWPQALRTVVIATAANLLPVPGGAIVRIQAIRAVGATTMHATGVNVAGAGMWVGAGLFVAGIVLAGDARPIMAAIAIATGFVAVTTGTFMIRRMTGPGWARAAGRLAGVEIGFALVHGVRLALLLIAVGVPASFGQGLVLGAAAPLAAAAGIFPAGIGLAEVLSALVAPLASLPEAAGFLVTGVARVLGLGLVVPLAFWLGLDELRHSPSEVDEPGFGS